MALLLFSKVPGSAQMMKTFSDKHRSQRFEPYWYKRSLRSAINYLLGNCYFTMGSIGICIVLSPTDRNMRSDPSSFMAKLFFVLLKTEEKWPLLLKNGKS